MMHRTLIAAAALLFLCTTTVVSSAIRSKHSFEWKACLNRDTGIASSQEKSTHVFQYDVTLPSPPSRSQIAKFAKDVFSNYPSFVGKKSVTLGLCRTIPSPFSCNTETSLSTSIVHLNLLTFGTPRVVTSSKSSLCCVEIPIQGGLLAVNAPPLVGDNHDMGCLRFKWIQQPNNNTSGQDSTITLITEITGSYQPSLAGNEVPRSRLRSIMYCSTQRMFHAYVMWRFHRYVVEEFLGKKMLQ
eukprot:scaffold14346_cov207-Alexandrium_tamarense.AAC.5